MADYEAVVHGCWRQRIEKDYIPCLGYTTCGLFIMSKRVFLREATGLVRQFSTTDALILSIGCIVGPTWVPIFASEWFLFPGVNVPVSFALAGILVLFNSLYYALIATAMPRSGGGAYVPLSRAIHPFLGMCMSFLFVITNILTMGFIASEILTVGVSAPLLTYAVVTSNTGLQSLASVLSTPTYTVLFGTVVLAFVGLVTISGARTVTLVNKIAIVVGTAGFLVIIGVLATSSQPQFQTALSSVGGPGAYEKIINSARSLGWSIPSDWVTPTLLSLPLTWLALIGGQYNAYWSGEVKSVQRSMLVSVILSVVYTAGFFSVVALMMQGTFGLDFLTSAGYLSNAYPANYTLPAAPWVNTFVLVLNSNVILSAILIASFCAWGYFLIVNYFLVASRHFLAWSFDRMFPSSMATVSERFHTPVYAIILTCIIGWVALVFYSLLPTILGAVSVTFLFLGAMVLDGLAGVALGVKKKFLETAPSICKRKIAGIPIISLLGAYSVILLASLLVVCLYNPAIGGPFGSATEATVVISLVIGGLLYLGMKYYGTRQGLDMSLIFKEIPPE